MASFVTTNLWQVSFFINHADNGWSESWYLRDQYHDQAKLVAADLLEARSWILADNHVIEWCELKQCQHPRSIEPAIGAPVAPLEIWGPSHDDTTGLLFRFQAPNGRYSNHLIRAIDDDEIKDARWLRWPISLPAGLAPKPADPTNATKDELFAYFLSLFREKTAHARAVPATVPGVDEWEVTYWSEVIYRKVGSGAYGSKYHRVSAEWADWNYAPPFSYCGTVCGVQRTCRAVETHPYIGGPPMVLRFYFADPGANICPYPTIFFGTYRDKQIPEDITPGEQKGVQHNAQHPNGKWEYSPGYSYGIAPGTSPTGTPADFLGLGIKPWLDHADLEPHIGAACDMPLFSFTIADTAPTTIVVSSCLRADFNNADFIVEQTSPGWAKISLRNTGFPTGTGTAGRVPVWVSGTVLGNSTASDNGAALALLKRFRTPKHTVAVPTDDETNLAIGDHTAVYLDGPSSLNTIRGLNTGYDGEWKFLFFNDNGFLLKHLDPTGNPSGKIDCSFVGEDVFFPEGSAAILFYDQAAGRWKLMAGPEASGDQTGTVSMTVQKLGRHEKLVSKLAIDQQDTWNSTGSLIDPHPDDLTILGDYQATAKMELTSNGTCSLTQEMPDAISHFTTSFQRLEIGCQESTVAGDNISLWLEPLSATCTLVSFYAEPAYCINRGGINLKTGKWGTLADGSVVSGGIITEIGPGGSTSIPAIFGLIP